MTIWIENDGWTYEVFHKNTPPAEFDQFQSFKELWDSKRDGDALPSWQSFSLEDFADWYGWITVDDVIPGPEFDSVFRLWGTNVTDLYGTDLTGKRMSEYPEFYSQEDFELSEKMVKEQIVSLSTGPMKWHDIKFKIFSFIELPLSDDGQIVDKFISLVSEVTAPEGNNINL